MNRLVRYCDISFGRDILAYNNALAVGEIDKVRIKGLSLHHCSVAAPKIVGFAAPLFL